MSDALQVGSQELRELFRIKYGDPATTGWAPRRRLQFGYFLPADYYEALIAKLVAPKTEWIDIGGGGALFPENRSLSELLSQRARRLVVVDPSDNVDSNPFSHTRAKCLIEEYQADAQFDLATFRMVVEHIADPRAVVQVLNRLVRPGGRVVVFTVNRWAPATVASRLLPFGWHHPIKRLFFGGEEKDTFPTVYRMNTRGQLRTWFGQGGFEERSFAYLDDLSILGRFRTLNYGELLAWKALRGCRLRYPENCLIGVYEKA